MLNDLVGRRVGIVRELQVWPPDAGDPSVWIAATDLASTLDTFGHEPASAGGGAALTPEGAAACALGESAERYAASSQCLWKIRRMESESVAGSERWRGLIAVGVRPKAECANWAWVNDDRGDPVPAALVFVPYAPMPGEEVPFVSISTGLSAAASRAEAESKGFLEIVERDAVARFWYGREGGSRIPLETASAGVIEAFAGAQARITLFSLDAFGAIPTALAILECVRGAQTIVAAGSASRPTWEEAADKALIESAHSRVYISHLLERSGPQGGTEWPPRSFEEHTTWPTRRPDQWREASRFLSKLKFGAVPGAVEVSRVIAAERGRLHFFDLTPVDLRAVGLHVVRAVLPELLPLPGNDLLRPILHARWPRTANPWPHPMP